MAKKINEKTAGISLAGFQPRAKPVDDQAEKKERVIDGQSPSPTPLSSTPPPAKAPKNSYTGAGIFMASITGKNEAEKELTEVQGQLAQALKTAEKFEGADLVVALDTGLVQRSVWANRNQAEFMSAEFKELREEICNAGGNTQPIKVRRVAKVIDGQSAQYEIVYGHRRYQACLEEGLKVNAIVVDKMEDRSLFEAMERENRGRKDLSAWEKGMMYQSAIDRNLYGEINNKGVVDKQISARGLAAQLNLNQSDLSRSLQLAKLPEEVIKAFVTPLDLQVRWAKDLTDAMQKDPESLLANARQIAANRSDLSATQVFEKLISKPVKASDIHEILVGGKKLATFKAGKKGRAVVEFEAGSLLPEKHAELVSLISKFLAS
jgi:ParB family chromosome partitioning protein